MDATEPGRLVADVCQEFGLLGGSAQVLLTADLGDATSSDDDDQQHQQEHSDEWCPPHFQELPANVVVLGNAKRALNMVCVCLLKEIMNIYQILNFSCSF
jgi:hypothetical protein